MTSPILFAGQGTDNQGQTFTQEQLAAAAAILTRQGAVSATPAPVAAPTSWGQLASRPAAPPAAAGVAVPLRLELRDGSSVEPILFFGPEWAGESALAQLLDALQGAGVPLKTWRPKTDDNYGGGRRGRGGRW